MSAYGIFCSWPMSLPPYCWSSIHFSWCCHGSAAALSTSKATVSSPPVTLCSPGHGRVAAIMSLAVTLLSHILSGGKQERVQRPHLNQAASAPLVCADNSPCSLGRSTKHANPQDIIIHTRQQNSISCSSSKNSSLHGMFFIEGTYSSITLFIFNQCIFATTLIFGQYKLKLIKKNSLILT